VTLLALALVFYTLVEPLGARLQFRCSRWARCSSSPAWCWR
jgi:hypothetical protein